MALNRCLSLALVVVGLCLQGTRGGRGLRGRNTPIQKLASEVLGGQAVPDYAAIEASIKQTFDAIPKNSLGQVPLHGIVPHMVRSYFASENGWLIRGLEPPTLKTTVTELHEARVLQTKAPSLAEALKEIRTSGLGLALSDIVAVIAVLEKLFLEDTMPLVEGSYGLNMRRTEQRLDEASVDEVLFSFLLVFRSGSSRNLTNVARHQKVKKLLKAKRPERWSSIRDFGASAIDPSRARKDVYTLNAVTDFAMNLTRRFGGWQNRECVDMKGVLMSVAEPGTGKVPYDVFSSQPKNAKYRFSESTDYIRSIGALDESDPSSPKVIIPNYVVGPSNCIASSSFYAICCLNECELLRRELEGKLGDSETPPQRVLDLVSTISSPTVDAPRRLPEPLRSELLAIGKRHGQQVPLHSSDFTWWLHRAFPNECPRPTAKDSAAEEAEGAIVHEWPVAPAEPCTRTSEEEDIGGHVGEKWSESLWFHQPDDHQGKVDL